MIDNYTLFEENVSGEENPSDEVITNTKGSNTSEENNSSEGNRTLEENKSSKEKESGEGDNKSEESSSGDFNNPNNNTEVVSENVTTVPSIETTPSQGTSAPIVYGLGGLAAGMLLGIGLFAAFQKLTGKRVEGNKLDSNKLDSNKSSGSADSDNIENMPSDLPAVEMKTEKIETDCVVSESAEFDKLDQTEKDNSYRPRGRREIPSGDKVGKLHNIGRRSGQQDSLGMTDFPGGMLAIVADGMGGLADGDKVSQKIVMTMLQDSANLQSGNTENKLYEMLGHAVKEVNQMLGPDKIYKCGSTVTSVIVEPGYFQWLTVGDSHIYLYRGNQLLLLNREHVYENELMIQAVNGEISFRDAKQHPKKSGLTSFVGMGEIKYIDGSMERLPSQKGDWLLLMSDGVFNTVGEKDICQILNHSQNAKSAAVQLEQEVLRRQNPKQDNFTAVLLEL